MAHRLPVTLTKTPSGYAIRCGGEQAVLYIYTESERVDRRHLSPDDAEAFAKDVARALQQSWVALNKHRP